MNVMNNNNIDNRFQLKRATSIKRSIKMGHEKKMMLKLRTVASEGAKESIEKAHPDAAKSTKVSSTKTEGKKVKRKRKSPLVPWKKPEGMPKRPLSAYNLFFQDRRKSIMLAAAAESRENLLEESELSHRKASKKRSGVGFANLARTIGTEWRALEPEKKRPYESLAGNDKGRYDREMKVWRAKEKEQKLMRQTNPIANSQSFGDVLPVLTSVTAARKGFGKDLIGSIGGRSKSVGMMPRQDHESRGLFHSSIYSNSNNNNDSYSMDTSSDQLSNMTALHRHQDESAYSSTFNENFFINSEITGASGSTPVPHCYFENAPFISSGSLSNNRPRTMPWSNNRNTLNMDNAMSSTIDLEPLPLPDSQYQYRQQMFSHKVRESQMGWSGQHGLQQMHLKNQQQKMPIVSDGFLQRQPTGGAPMYSTGWGQNSSWNTNNIDATEPIAIPLGDGNSIQEPVENAEIRTNDTRSFPSSNNPNQDPWTPLGFFHEDPN